eukprot:6206001-Pleurochrysis_carterae.AAC.1
MVAAAAATSRTRRKGLATVALCAPQTLNSSPCKLPQGSLRAWSLRGHAHAFGAKLSRAVRALNGINCVGALQFLTVIGIVVRGR